MKRWPLFLSIALAAQSSSGQEAGFGPADPTVPPRVLVCDNGSGGCHWEGGAGPTAQLPAQSQFPSQTQFPDQSQFQTTDPSAPMIAAPPEAVSWLYAWRQSVPSALAIRPPPLPQCAYSVDEAMGRFTQGVASQDINMVISSYDWAGLSEAQADPILAQLQALGPGSWIARVVEGRYGGTPDQPAPPAPPTRLRWVSGSSAVEFSTVERAGCWFLSFAPMSDQTSPQQVNAQPVIQVPPGSGYAEPAPPVQPQYEEPALQVSPPPDDNGEHDWTN
jgi:hypothetical protein